MSGNHRLLVPFVLLIALLLVVAYEAFRYVEAWAGIALGISIADAQAFAAATFALAGVGLAAWLVVVHVRALRR